MARPNTIDLTNKRFGRLVVARQFRLDGYVRCECLCDCGNEKTVHRSTLIAGNVKSCGCLRAETTKARSKTHGLRHTPEYAIWNTMRQRCGGDNSDYHRYGGRGITVCDRWANDFANFFSDMGSRPSLKHSLDRIDNSRGYEPGNCRWATREEQANNQRSNRLIDFMGERLTLRQIARKTNCTIPFRTLRARVYERGWPIERAIGG